MEGGLLKRTKDRNSLISNVPSSKLLTGSSYHTSNRLIDFFPNIYITSASSSQDFCSFAPWGYFGTRCIFSVAVMTHDQHNATRRLISYMSHIFLCHSNLRLSFFPTFCEHSFFPPSLFPCYLFTVPCYSVYQQSFRSSSNHLTIQ